MKWTLKTKTQHLKELQDLFGTKWMHQIDAKTVNSRPYKPQGYTPNQKSLNNLVFEAFGSDTNREVFVLCGNEINAVKALLWRKASPMADKIFKDLVYDSTKGDLSAARYISALRSVGFTILEHDTT